MRTWMIWDEPNARPEEPASERLRTPWLVEAGTKCPVCGDFVPDRAGLTVHACGEELDVRDQAPELVLLVKYPVGYSVVRSELWERFLFKGEIQSDTNIPISSMHAAPWVIWNGNGNAPDHWTRAHRCPECDAEHRGLPQVAIRCQCRARLLPVSMNVLEEIEVEDIASKFWEEQAFYLTINGVHTLFPTANMPPRPHV